MNFGNHISTNSKLYEIIHSKNNDEDDEDDIQERERRSSLYGGGGARTKIPKIKKKAEISGSSPIVLGERDMRLESLPLFKELDNSVPPGAHSDQFRLVSNPTSLSMKDPDRVFYNTTSMAPHLHVVSQPAWYFGNNNKIKPSDGHLLIAAGRYGYRGSQGIKQYSTEAYEDPRATRTDQTPAHLTNGDSYVNEYVPKIVATIHQSCNSLESPKLWPENTEFVSGYPKKKFPSSHTYRRETTVDTDDIPQAARTLSRTMSVFKENDDKLKTMAKEEMRGTVSSLTIDSKTSFEKAWGSKVKKFGSQPLKYHLKKEKPLYEAHTLLDPSDLMKYSGTTAMIVHTQSTDEYKFRLRMERSKSKTVTPFDQRWNHVVHLFQDLNNKLKRKETMDIVIYRLADALQETALRRGSETTISRVDFIDVCKSTKTFDDSANRLMSIMYSIFDPMKKNDMRFVELIASLIILDKAGDTAEAKLETLWDTYYKYGL